MAVKIRLKKFGKRSKATYRIVVLEEGAKRQGREIEVLGNYDPTIDPPSINVNKERINYWINTGAKCTDTVFHLLKKVKKN